MAHIVAAIDDNHNGDLNTARRLIDLAVECGCRAVKFTARTVGLSAADAVLNRKYFLYPSLGDTHRSVRDRLTLGPEQHGTLLETATGRLEYIVAPYDLPALHGLDGLRLSSLQIDPACATNTPLLSGIAQRAMPTLLDTGGCTAREVREAVTTLEKVPLTLIHGLHTDVDATLANVKALDWLRTFSRPIGYRDAEPGYTLALVAVLLGVDLVEKRLTLDRSAEGPHHASSLLPSEMRDFVQRARELSDRPAAELRYQILASNRSLTDERPSVVALCDIPKGTQITAEMLGLKPPLRGLSPRLLPWVVGRSARYHIAADEHVTFGLLD